MLLPYLNKDLIEAGCDEAGRGCCIRDSGNPGGVPGK